MRAGRSFVAVAVVLLMLAATAVVHGSLVEGPAEYDSGYSQSETLARVNKVKAFLKTHATFFTRHDTNRVFAHLHLLVKGGSGLLAPNPKLPGDRDKWQRVFAFERVIAPYVPHGTPTTSHGRVAVHRFIDKVFELNNHNPIFTGFLNRLVLQYPDEGQWVSLLRGSMDPARHDEDLKCTQHNDPARALMETLHIAVVLDHLTRLMYNEPLEFLQPVDELFTDLLSQVTLDGIDVFYQIKFPSVVKPIKEFIAANQRKADAAVLDAADQLSDDDDLDLDLDSEDELDLERVASNHKTKAAAKTGNLDQLWRETHALVPRSAAEHRREMEELIEDGTDITERAMLRFFAWYIDADPTEALRVNIKEAAYGCVVLFSKRKDLVPLGQLPPATSSGVVLASDRMFGSPKGCDEACMEQFASGKFTFTDSAAWMHLYSGWNLALMLSSGSGEWWAKLVTPAVVEDLSGETYIIRRTIALWLTLFRKTFLHSRLKNEGRCMRKYSFNIPEDVQHIMGEESRSYGEFYREKWSVDATRCDECEASYNAMLGERSTVSYVDMLVHLPHRADAAARRVAGALKGVITKMLTNNPATAVFMMG